LINKIKGQDKVVASLIRSIENDKVGQSYLFYGPTGVGKLTTAFYFVMAINCTNREEGTPCGKCNSCRKFMELAHPDLIYLFPTPNLKLSEDGEIKETKFQKEYQAYLQRKVDAPWNDYVFSASSEIRIGAIRWIQNRLSFSKNEAKKRVCIIEDADRMNVNTANAFLKTLEEPPEDTVIILTTSKLNSLLPTIISRCQRVAFNNLSNSTVENILRENFNLDIVKSKTYSRISYGNAEKAIQLISEDTDSGRNIALKLIELALKRDDIEFLSYLNQLKDVKQKKILQSIHANIVLFLMDIIYRRENSELIINVDSLELLGKIEEQKTVTSLEIYQLIDACRELQRMIKLNVNNNLIVTFLYNKLKKLLKK
jgi:DNA polymerase-3 subunit delta'